MYTIRGNETLVPNDTSFGGWHSGHHLDQTM